MTVRTRVKRLTETTHFEGSRKADHFWIGDTAVVAEVEDTGTGISDQYMAKVFDPFFTTKAEGMGMGLVLCKSIADSHGIELSFEANSDGPGTTFELTFPTGVKAR